MCAETPEEDVESLRLPKNWHSLVCSAVLNVIGIVRIALLTGREALIKNGDSKDARIHQLESEVAMLREELRITGARMQRVPATQTTAVHSDGTDGDPAIAGHAGLEQGGGQSPLPGFR